MINDRLKYFRQKVSKSASQFAKDNKMDPRTYNNYETGERMPPLGFLVQLNNIYGININWLVTGHGHIYEDGFYEDKNCISVPILGDKSDTLGIGMGIYTEEDTGFYAISKQLLDVICPNKDVAKIIFATGDSMESAIKDGDSLLIDTSKNIIKDGKIYCIKYLEQITTKRLQRVSKSIVNIISDNPKYKIVEIDLDKNADELQVIGEVKWIGRIAK